MTATQQDIVDALTAQAADLNTFGATLAVLLRDIDALVAAKPATPDFTAILASIAVNRATLGKFASETAAEIAVVAPPAAPATLTVSPTSLTLVVGQNAGLSAVASNGAPVTFASGNAAVATVDPAGLVTGIAPGSATITVSSTTIPSAVTVTVVVG